MIAREGSCLLLGAANLADGGAALRALALGHGAAVLGGDLDSVLHLALSLALHAIAFHNAPPESETAAGQTGANQTQRRGASLGANQA